MNLWSRYCWASSVDTRERGIPPRAADTSPSHRWRPSSGTLSQPPSPPPAGRRSASLLWNIISISFISIRYVTVVICAVVNIKRENWTIHIWLKALLQHGSFSFPHWFLSFEIRGVKVQNRWLSYFCTQYWLRLSPMNSRWAFGPGGHRLMVAQDLSSLEGNMPGIF